MPWKRSGNELVLVEPLHYDPDEIRHLISQLRDAHGKAVPVIALLQKLLDDGLASEDLIFQFSKWCKWSHQNSETIAQSIASKLFYGQVCRRLLDESNRKIPDPRTANADYKDWMDRVLLASQGLPGDTVFPDDADHVYAYVEGALVQRVVNAYERDPEARRKCIQRYGTKCYICNFDFGHAYYGIGNEPYPRPPLAPAIPSSRISPSRSNCGFTSSVP